MNHPLRLTVIILLLAASNLSAATLRVCLESTNPTAPYAAWAAAAANIQDAVDAAQAGEAVLVTNGTYATGGRAIGANVLVNRVAVLGCAATGDLAVCAGGGPIRWWKAASERRREAFRI